MVRVGFKGISDIKLKAIYNFSPPYSLPSGSSASLTNENHKVGERKARVDILVSFIFLKLIAKCLVHCKFIWFRSLSLIFQIHIDKSSWFFAINDIWILSRICALFWKRAYRDRKQSFVLGYGDKKQYLKKPLKVNLNAPKMFVKFALWNQSLCG